MTGGILAVSLALAGCSSGSRTATPTTTAPPQVTTTSSTVGANGAGIAQLACLSIDARSDGAWIDQNRNIVVKETAGDARFAVVLDDFTRAGSAARSGDRVGERDAVERLHVDCRAAAGG